ncbi:MAG: DUF3616 domain-containing protein [Calditrichia bacterium]
MATLIHHGVCDASAAIPLTPGHFLLAGDEDNILRFYNATSTGGPILIADIAAYFPGNEKNAETDIEGASQLGDTIFWITSHGRNRRGKHIAARYYFFANTVQLIDGELHHQSVGQSYQGLLEDMLNDPALDKYELKKAAKRAPKSGGGLNIEGLAATPEQKLLIGFRNPVPDDRALILQLENPFGVLQGERALFSEPIELDLDGLGIRSIEYWPTKNCYLIIGGAFSGVRKFGIYRWSGKRDDLPERLNHLNFNDLNPEGLVIYPEEPDHFQIISDDGNVERDNCRCKRLPEGHPGKYFRSQWFKLEIDE